ncbi:MAG: hypothetical protein N3G78_00855 [Desulfobacterota bacterium]|nr:hypothetical protein [Thermodesulfobacteriota bacterium]
MIRFQGRAKILPIAILLCSMTSTGLLAEETNLEGWPIPDLRGLVPYSISIQRVDGIEKIVERFRMPDGGHVARISGNGKVFAYAVDRDLNPPIDYLLLDVEGFGRFSKKLRSDETYSIPDWVFR